MADEADAAEAGDGQAGKKKLSGKKLVLFVVLPVLLLAIIGGGAAVFLLGGDSGGHEEVADAESGHGGGGGEAESSHGGGHGEEASAGHGSGPGGTVFYDLPDMLVNLNTGGKRSTYLKLKIALEVSNQEAVKEVERVLPRITDNFQTYLRELRLEDLSGSAGLVRLKEELLVRINLAAGTGSIKDVLFKEMLVQ